SSRRRHTRSYGDWSSDVCSSDLKALYYAKIWNHERNESPLKTITRSQAEKLARALGPVGKHLVVDWAMRYGSPSIASRLGELVRSEERRVGKEWRCRRWR